MKKSLILLPLTALFLSGCMLLPGKKTSSSSSSPSSGSSDQPSVDPGSGGGGESQAVDFDLTPGTHTAIIDFANNADAYSYPKAEGSDTEAREGDNAGITWNYFHTYKSGFEGETWLHLRNAKSASDPTNWYETGFAWFGNATNLGSITSIEATVRSSASTKLSYYLTVGSSEFTSAQQTGVMFTSAQKGVYTGSGNGYFAISTYQNGITADNAKNGQITLLKVTYTI